MHSHLPNSVNAAQWSTMKGQQAILTAKVEEITKHSGMNAFRVTIPGGESKFITTPSAEALGQFVGTYADFTGTIADDQTMTDIEDIIPFSEPQDLELCNEFVNFQHNYRVVLETDHFE
ncbi:hypothetical protein RCL1_007211 [Eukaryota sp. TZLM3-RCL]